MGEPLHVLHLLGMIGSHRGGSATATMNIAEATRDGGDHATILTTAVDGEDLSAVRAIDGVEVVACRRQWPRHVSVSWPLVAWLWRNARRFDLIEMHEVFAFPTLACWAVARLRRVPYVLHPHGSLEPFDMRKHARVKDLLRPGLRRLLRGSAAVWLTAEQEAENLTHLGDGFRTVVSPLPVPAPSHPGDRAAFRARYGIDEADPVVLFLGRVDYKKGIHRLLSAFETVADTLPRALLVIAGSGDEAFVEEVRHRVAASRHPDAIRMVGFLSGREKADALAGADLFALHSDSENFGIAPVESLRGGTPVLLSDQVHIAADLAASGAAVVVPVGDAAALAAELHDLLSTPDRLARLTASAADAAAPYLPDRVARQDAAVRRELVRSA